MTVVNTFRISSVKQVVPTTCLSSILGSKEDKQVAVLGGGFAVLTNTISTALQVPVVQRLDNAIHRINHYPVNKC